MYENVLAEVAVERFSFAYKIKIKIKISFSIAGI